MRRSCEKGLQSEQKGKTLAVDGGVIRTSVCFQVKVQDLSTVGDVLVNVVQCVRLHAGGEGNHLSFLTLVPDDALDETLAAAHGVEVDGGGGGLELHWGCVPVDVLIIGQDVGRVGDSVPLQRVAQGG